MNCPHCGGATGIWKTRAPPNRTVLREPRCKKRGCRAQFVTVEQIRRTLGTRISVARKRKRKTPSA